MAYLRFYETHNCSIYTTLWILAPCSLITEEETEQRKPEQWSWFTATDQMSREEGRVILNSYDRLFELHKQISRSFSEKYQDKESETQSCIKSCPLEIYTIKWRHNWAVRWPFSEKNNLFWKEVMSVMLLTTATSVSSAYTDKDRK